MAEPPNALTDFLRKAATPEEVYEILNKEKCLTPLAARERSKVIEVINDAEASHRRQVAAVMVGGTREYVIAGALFNASYLNNKARRLLDTQTVFKSDNRTKTWWRFW